MRKLALLTTVVVFLFGCNPPAAKIVSGLLSTDSLPVQNFVIDINRDTLLHTSNGSWIKIDKGTFSAANGKVALEIKEALTMQQIIKAGLVTASNGQPLSSGGMIYINAAAGQTVTINKPFKIAVPATSLDKNMQLFKGEKTADSTINWKDPKALDDNLQMSAVKKGEILFQQKCASCHGIGKEGSGPDLAHVVKRLLPFWGEGGTDRWSPFEHDYRQSYVVKSDSPESRESTHMVDVVADSFVHPPSLYVCNLMALFNNQAVDLSADFQKDKNYWPEVYQYIENESNLRNLPYPRHAYLDSCIDSCSLYNRVINELNKKKLLEEIKRERFIEENGSLVERIPDPTWGVTNQPPPDLDKKVVPNEYDAVYYQFTIETFGWYNIDMLMVKKEGVADSELFVKVVGAYRQRVKIYLIIPSAKVLGEGGPAEKDKELYAFFYKSGFIPLPQNATAYILAVTDTENAVAYGLKKFTTSTKQQLEIELKPSTKTEFDAAIKSMGGDKLSITVAESKNAVEIKTADKKIKELEEGLKDAERLKPKRCDCECRQPGAH